MTLILGALFSSAVVCTGLLFIVEPLLARRAVVDTPNERSSHDRPVLRGGGLGPAGSVVGVGAVLSVAGASVGGGAAWVILAAVTMFAALGWVEDTRGVPAVVRAGVQVTLGGVACAALLVLLHGALWWWPVGALAIAGFVNVANFMDGLNGLSSLAAVVVGSTYAVVGLFEGLSWLAWSGAAIAGAFLAFLPWNAIRPRMFLGDVGSYTLGAAIATTGAAALLAEVPVMLVIAPLVVYLTDAGVTLLRRVARGDRWWEPHRSHTYQRMVDRGLSHLAVAGIVALGSGLCAVSALLCAVNGIPQEFALLPILAVVGGYMALPRVLAHRQAAGA